MNLRALSLTALSLLAIATTNTIFSQTCWIKTSTTSTGAPVYTEVYEYDYVEQKPEFPGGRSAMINYINSERQYPAEAYQMGIEGRVTCAFIVNPDGRVSHVSVLRGVESTLNQEAIRIISAMPKWSPGIIEGVRVPTRVVCCIPFRK